MTRYKYLIVGGGMTAASAVEGIRKHDRSGSIGLISLEADPPYDRPPLSKKLWSGKPLDSIWRKTGELGVDMHLGRRGSSIDPENRRVTDDRGDDYRYEKLLLATGGSPRRLSADAEGMIYFRTLEDYRALRAAAEVGRRVAIIGGGFIGSELAAALAGAGCSVTMLFPGSHICGRIFPPDLGAFVDRYYLEKGVDVRAGRRIESVEKGASSYHLVATTNDPSASVELLDADIVVAGTGVKPNIALAVAAGLAVADGIVVDKGLRTSNAHIFAAGDVASFPSEALGRRVRVEHEDNSNTMGAAAGEAMTGYPVTYTHLPSFYSDLFDLGYEAVGDLDSSLEIVADWKEPFREGIVYYLRDDKPVGVLLWNVWGQVPFARSVIAEGHSVKGSELSGRIPVR